jgi:polyhydroxybutyrate depolymerase
MILARATRLLVLGLLAASSACGRTDATASTKTSSPPASGPALVAARPYALDVPPGYDPSHPAPLLLSLHGFGDTGENLGADRWPLAAVARAHGAFVAHPNGTLSSSQERYWNATDACCSFEGAAVDDVAYLTAVIDDVSRRYAIDPKRIWASGISNGGFMSHRLACDRSSRIAAIVSLAGATWLDASKCAQDAPVSVLEIHGADDPLVKYEGGTSRGGRGAVYPSVDATVAESAAKNACSGALVPRGTAQGFDGQDLTRTTEIGVWSGCPAGIDVERWKMNGARHVPMVTRAWADAVVAWLERHPKPGAVSSGR